MAKKAEKKTKKPEMKQKEKPVSRKKKSSKKKFFQAEIPLTSTKVQLYSHSPEDLVGSIVKLDLTKNLRGKNLELKSKIIPSQHGKDKLVGDLLGLKITPSYIKRAMRRGIDYVEDSFSVTCKDSKLIVKPFMITRKRVSRAIKKEIRKIAKKSIESNIKIRNTEEIFSEIMTNKLQKTISQKVKKIYPLALCEIRVIEVLEKIEKKE
jgi:ribosomal protein S3AE